MKNNKLSFFIFASIISFMICALVKTPNQLHQIKEMPSILKSENEDTLLSLENLDEPKAKLSKINSTATFTFHEDYKVIEHQLVLIPENLPENIYFTGWKFTLFNNNLLYDISISCEIRNKLSKKECNAICENENNNIIFYFIGEIFKDDILIVNYKYKEKFFQDLLLIMEEVSIPLFKDSIFCNYKFILPDDYVNLGLKNDILTKQFDKTYIYYGQCPSEIQKEVIRYSPEKVKLEANIELLLEKSFLFNDIIDEAFLTFPRYYIGGKIKNDFYEIKSLDNEIYQEKKYIYEDTKYQFTIPAANKEKVGIKINTIFDNNLNDEFKVYFPESYYEIDLSKIDQEIIDKANEIIKDESEKPNYYKIGKFVNSYIKYEDSYTGKNLTLKEIYEGKKGVCEHKTLLYNAMLNAIGIKTLYLFGWIFHGNNTSINLNIGHAWTAALIDNKWIELDATNGFFEGIPAELIMFNFFYPIIKYGPSLFFTLKKDYKLKIISINEKFNFLGKHIIIGGIILGLCFILCILFYIKKKHNKSRTHSKLIEEIKNIPKNIDL